MHLELPNMREGYVTVAREVMSRGELASPRGERTREVLDATLVVTDPYDLLPVGTGRKVHVGMAALEALQVLGGYSDVEAMRRASPHLAAFEDFGQYHGAYGPRLRPWLAAVVARLHQDRESRRAYVSLWDPARDLLVHGVKNYPCWVSFQFMIRKDRLLMQVHFRANDVWRGLSADSFVAGQVQHTVANCLGVEPGEYRHHAASLHVYDIHWDLVDSLSAGDAKPPPATGFSPSGTARLSLMPGDYQPSGEVESAMARARHVGLTGTAPERATESELWYAERAGPFCVPPAAAEAH